MSAAGLSLEEALERLRISEERLRTAEAKKDWNLALLRVLPSAGVSRRVWRGSLGVDEVPATVWWGQAGHHFRFVNREEQCLELLEVLCRLERLRLRASTIAAEGRWEALKREAVVPVCTGMPGLGKTRFARDAIFHLARSACGGDTLESVVEAATHLRDNATDASVTQALARASFMDRNLRIDFSDFNDVPNEAQVAAALLGEWAKHREAGLASRVRDGLRGTDVTLLDAVRYIFANCADSADPDAAADGPLALMINFDEAHVLPEGAIGLHLRAALRLLLVNGLRVFVTVTGVNATRIHSELDGSQIRPHDICLPLLTMEHTLTVARSFLPEAEMDRPLMRHVLWWLGGVPRFLEYLVGAAAHAAGLPDETGPRQDVAAFLKRLEPAGAGDLISAIAARLWDHTIVTTNVLDEAFSFAVMGASVPRDFHLTESVTVQQAQKDSLLYWRSTGGAREGVIQLPPLVLHWRQRWLAPTQRLFPMQNFVPFMSPRDNESVAAGVLMHKARAAVKLGRDEVLLSSLGIPVHAALIPDITVRLPACFDVVRTDGNVTADNFKALVERVRSSATPVSTPVAFVNAATASFADAFLILPNIVIFIQEKQRVEARLAAACGTTIPTAGAGDLWEEYEKLGDYASSLPHVFLYITDELAPGKGGRGKNRCVVGRDGHERLLGTLCAHLRACALAPSSIDLRAATVAAAGAGAGGHA